MLAAKNLRKRKVAYVKGVDHLFIHCLAISRLWGEILSWFGPVSVMPHTVKELIFTWNYGHYDKRRKICRAWNVVLPALIWIILRENKRALSG